MVIEYMRCMLVYDLISSLNNQLQWNRSLRSLSIELDDKTAPSMASFYRLS